MSKQERSKPGSLLESWFGRPKIKSKNHSSNTGRSVSADGDADLNELENEIKKLSEKDVEAKFIDILEDMNIPKDKRQPLILKPITEKKEIIFMHLKGKSSSEHRSNSKFEKPYDYIEYLQSGEHSESKLYQCIESLRVALTSNTISWIKEFGEEGIDEIVNLLQKCKNERNFDRIEFECLRCLKAILNNTWGLNLVLKPDQHAVVMLLAQSLNPKKPHTMSEALKLLAGFCLLPERNGYEKVLMAITNAASANYKSGERFKPIVDGLFVEEKNDSKRELCSHSLIFINTIINTPTDLNFRLHLRCEIMRMGLYEKIETLTNVVEKSSNENLKKHFKIFNDIRDDDFEEFSQRFDNVRFDLDDINDCFEVLKNLIVDTSAEPFFLSILQHLLYIRDDFYYRPAYYQLIEECVSQIVFHKGCDPHFENRNFNIDTSLILECTVEKTINNEKTRNEECEKKLEALEITKQEAEARVAHLEEKIKLLENSLGGGPDANNLKNSNFSINTNIRNVDPNVSKIPPPPPPPFSPNAPILNRGPAPPPPPPPPPGHFPPSINAQLGGPPPPPPPIGNFAKIGNNLPFGLKQKKKWDTKTPMKRANWKAIVPQKLSEKSFWMDCREENLASEDFLSELGVRFSSKPIKKETKDSVDKPTTLKKNVIELRVLDSKAAQNISILLQGSLKHMAYDEIKSCLYKCDTKVLTQNIVQQLIQYLPPPEQLKKLQDIKQKGEEISGVELFVATIGEITRLNHRLQNLHFRLMLPDMIQDIKPDIVAGTAACEEVRNSRKFAKILELILLLGNYMNSGSKNEQAYGFEFSFLSKLSHTKDYENKKSLLHYIADTVENKFPDTLTFFEDLTHVDKASRVSLENVQKTMRQINNSLKNLENDLNLYKNSQCPEDKFIDVMGKFADECREQINVLGKMQVHMEKLYTDLAVYFAFDQNKYTMEEFFSDIKTFKDSFMNAYKDNKKQREEEAKTMKLREARERSQRDLLERQQRKLALVDIDAVHTQEGVMDSLLEALQTGSAFGNREKRRPRPAGAERRAQLSRSRSRTRINNSNLTTTREMLSNEILLSS